MTAGPHFSPALFDFLRELKANNDKDWFKANQERFERDVRGPALRFISDFAPLLAEIGPRYLAIAKKVGGSLFRIHRDVRFAKDKSPYKTNVGIHFRHEAAKDAHAPGFYLHLSPGEVFMGGGIWHPDSTTLGLIRDRIVEDADGWRALMGDPAFEGTWHLGGDSLKRPPRGYDADHPLVEDLKRKDFIATRTMGEEDATTPDFLERFAESCRELVPLNRWLTRAVGLDW